MVQTGRGALAAFGPMRARIFVAILANGANIRQHLLDPSAYNKNKLVRMCVVSCAGVQIPVPRTDKDVHDRVFTLKERDKAQQGSLKVFLCIVRWSCARYRDKMTSNHGHILVRSTTNRATRATSRIDVPYSKDGK